MEKKKIWLIAAGCIAAAVILAMLLLPGADEPRETGPGTSAPGIQEFAPGGAEPAQTQSDEPEESEPVQTEPEASDPVQTEPEETEPEQTRPIYTEPEQTEPPVYDTVSFPVEIENGLVVRSIFQFSGMNPDADNMFGEEIAGVQMVNTSEEHLTRAEITAVLGDGTTLTFLAEDVPAGETVTAFCLEHERLPNADMCEDIFGWAEFESEDPRNPELVEIRVDGTEITIKNVSGRSLTELNVFCHSVLDGSCFGGTTYSYQIAALPAGRSAVVIAEDCFLGMAEVVRVDIGG